MLGCWEERGESLAGFRVGALGPMLGVSIPVSPGCPTSQTWSPPSCTSLSCLLGERQLGGMQAGQGGTGQGRQGTFTGKDGAGPEEPLQD